MVFGHLGLIPLALETSAPAGSSVEDLRGFKVSFQCVNYYHGCRWIDHPPSTEHPSTRILQGLQLEGRPKKRRASRFMMLPHKWLARWAMFFFGEGSWYGVRARSGGMRWNVHYRVDINIDNYVCVSRAVIFGLYIYIGYTYKWRICCPWSLNSSDGLALFLSIPSCCNNWWYEGWSWS